MPSSSHARYLAPAEEGDAARREGAQGKEEGGSRRAATGRRDGLRVLVADDTPVVREGLQALLEVAPGVDEVATAADAEAMLDAARQMQPDVVLLDMDLQGEDGLVLTRTLHAHHPDVAVLLFADQASAERARHALAAGASGVLLKTVPVADLLNGLVDAAGGGVVLDPDLEPAGGSATPLTTRERQVAQLMASGMSNKQISRSLFISGATVKCHVESIRRKLGTSNRAAAVGEAIRRGLVA